MAWVKVADSYSGQQGSRRSGQRIMYFSEEATGDSNKTFDYDTEIGSGSEFEFNHIRVEYTASATVGTRTLFILVLDSGGDTVRAFSPVIPGDTITAGNTYTFEFAHNYIPAATSNDLIKEPLPLEVYLLPGMSIQVLDSSAIDATGDDMILHFSGKVE